MNMEPSDMYVLFWFVLALGVDPYTYVGRILTPFSRLLLNERELRQAPPRYFNRVSPTLGSQCAPVGTRRISRDRTNCHRCRAPAYKRGGDGRCRWQG